MSMTWSEYCKQYSKQNNISYKESMVECKDLWKTYKEQQASKKPKMSKAEIKKNEKAIKQGFKDGVYLPDLNNEVPKKATGKKLKGKIEHRAVADPFEEFRD
jgi:hypothetical protein